MTVLHPDGTHVKTLNTAGAFPLPGRRGLEEVLIVIDGDKVIVADLDGEILVEHTQPAPGITYVGNRRPRRLDPKPDQTPSRS